MSDFAEGWAILKNTRGVLHYYRATEHFETHNIVGALCGRSITVARSLDRTIHLANCKACFRILDKSRAKSPPPR
jgi:hypothetical protein